MSDGVHKHSRSFVDEDQLSYARAVDQRAKWRIGFAVALGILGAAAMVFAFFPLIAKSAMPLIWVDIANNEGWNANLQEIGMRLLANGRIELMPMWGSYTLIVLGALLVWLGVHIYRSRRDARLFGDLLTLSYWMSFYWLKKPVAEVRVKTQRQDK